MAEIRTDQRQVPTPGAPDLSGASQVHSGFGRTMEKTAHTIADVVDSSNQLEAKAQYAETLNQLNKEVVNALSTESIAQGGAYDRYLQTAEAIIEGGMQFTPRRYKSELSLDLREKVNQLGLKIAQADLNFRESQVKAEGEVILSTHMDALNESVEAGDYEAVEREREILDSTLVDLQNVGALDAADVYKVNEKIKRAIVRSDYLNEYSNLLRTDPVKADLFLREIAEKKPEGITHEEWKDVQGVLLEENRNYYKMVDAAETLGKDEFQLAFDEGKINNFKELNDFIGQKEAQGRYFSHNDKLKMKDALVRANREHAKAMANVLAIDNDLANGSDNIYNYSESDLKSYYQEKSAFLIDLYEQQKLQDPNLEVPSPLAVKAGIAAQLPIPLRQFNLEYADKLQFGTIEDFEEAMKVGTQLLQNSPKTFSNLDKESQSYQQYAAKLFANTTLTPQNIKAAADKMINQKDTETEKKLTAKLVSLHKTSVIKDLYKDIYKTKFVNPALQPQFNNVSDTFDTFYRMTGDKDLAVDLTKNFMRTRTGTSSFIPKDDITKDPIEQTPLYRDHETLAKNQMALAAFEVTTNNNMSVKEGFDVGLKIEWPDDVEKPDLSKMTEKQLYDSPLWKNKRGQDVYPHLKINGKNRRLFFMNPNTDLEDPTSDQREMWYEDEFGLAQPLYILQKNEYANGLVKMDTGIPSLQFQSPEKITPEMAAIKDNEKYTDMATQHLREEFRKKKKVDKEKERKENLKKGNISIQGMPKTASVLDNIDAVKRKLALQKEEDAFVAVNIGGKIKSLKEDKQKKLDDLIKGNK